MGDDTRYTTPYAGADLRKDAVIRIALQCIIEHGGEAQIADIHDAVEDRFPEGHALNKVGCATVSHYVNTDAVERGYVYPHDRSRPGWRITPEGREFVGSEGN